MSKRKRKRCTRCKRVRDVGKFSPKGGGRLSSFCRSCRSTAVREKHITLSGRAGTLLREARRRAKARRLPFDLDPAWAIERLECGVCEVSGVPLLLTNDKWHRQAPSIDQRDANGGYTKANSRIVTWHINQALSHYEDDEFRALMLHYLQAELPRIIVDLGAQFTARPVSRLPALRQLFAAA